MRTGHLWSLILVGGVLSVASSGCSSSIDENVNPPDHGSGGAVTTPGSTQNGGSDTAQGTGGAQGGSTGSGGSAGQRTEGSGGSSKGGRGGSTAAGGAAGRGNGGATAGTGGKKADGGMADGSATGTSGSGGTGSGKDAGTKKDSGSSGQGGSTGGGTCTASKTASARASGRGPHKVTVETNSDPGIKEGTIFRPADLGGAEKYPIFVWGEGGCSLNGLSNSTALGEIASYGYFVIADGTPNGSSSRSMDSSNPAAMGKPLLAYIDWAIAENEKPCSAYYQSLDTTKIASNGFSCGGLMAEGTAGDSRMTTWGLNSSGLFGANQAFYKTIHTPVLLVLGGADDMAYENGKRDYDNISPLGIPIVFFSKALGHGGDLFSINGGDFTRINLAWLNWWLKGDETATGKGFLIGDTCTLCKDSAWEVKSKNID